jgi:hypothetical protein
LRRGSLPEFFNEQCMSIKLFLVLAFLISFEVSCQSITGRVFEVEGGKPIPGVNILQVNTVNFTISREDGSFSLKMEHSKDSSIIIFRLNGYKPYDQKVLIRSDTINLHVFLPSKTRKKKEPFAKMVTNSPK